MGHRTVNPAGCERRCLYLADLLCRCIRRCAAGHHPAADPHPMRHGRAEPQRPGALSTCERTGSPFCRVTMDRRLILPMSPFTGAADDRFFRICSDPHIDEIYFQRSENNLQKLLTRIFKNSMIEAYKTKKRKSNSGEWHRETSAGGRGSRSAVNTPWSCEGERAAGSSLHRQASVIMRSMQILTEVISVRK